MATSVEYIEFVCNQIMDLGEIRYKKMFGEYMIYVEDKPILLVCDSTVYVKKRIELEGLFEDTQIGIPYEGAKEHYILDVEDTICCEQAITILKDIIPIPKPRKKKKQ